MKLSDVKEQIDNYFDSISSDELFEVSITKYGFSKVELTLLDQAFESKPTSTYFPSNLELSMFNSNADSSEITAA